MTKKQKQTPAATKSAKRRESTAPTMNAEVALLLANLMAHPMLPKEIYNAVGEALTEIENDIRRTETQTDSVSPELTPEHIERVLNAQDGMGHRAFGVFSKGKRPDGYARFELKGFDGAGRR